jgi:hypothetical protein
MSIDPTRSMHQLPEYKVQEPAKPKEQTVETPPPSQPNPIFVPPHPLRRQNAIGDIHAQRAYIQNIWPDVHFGD